jgi:hypothetical protein
MMNLKTVVVLLFFSGMTASGAVQLFSGIDTYVYRKWFDINYSDRNYIQLRSDAGAPLAGSRFQDD